MRSALSSTFSSLRIYGVCRIVTDLDPGTIPHTNHAEISLPFLKCFERKSAVGVVMSSLSWFESVAILIDCHHGLEDVDTSGTRSHELEPDSPFG